MQNLGAFGASASSSVTSLPGDAHTTSTTTATTTTATPAGNMLFLQLTVEDLGICLPLVSDQQANAAHPAPRDKLLSDGGAGNNNSPGVGTGAGFHPVSSFASTLPDGVGDETAQ